MSLLINQIIGHVITEFNLPEPEWKNDKLTVEDIKFLQEECTKSSEFDPLNKRVKLFNEFVNDRALVQIASCNYGKMIAILENPKQVDDVPWSLWGRILRMYSYSKSHLPNKPFKIYFLATTPLREFPQSDKPIGPENINGGYTYRCNRETIVIYRAEDATRVLLHELLHACCCDDPQNDLDTIESETEAWAELIYIAILSKGKKYIFNDLLKRQSEWMIKQNEKVRKHMKDPNSREFPWRYTIGKEEVWRRWGILKEEKLPPPININESLRLTYPPNNMLKERFNVNKKSTIL